MIALQIFDTLLEPVFVLNAEKKVVYCNETAALLCDLSIRKITRGMVFDQLFQFNEPLEFLNNLVSISDPTPYREIQFTNSAGKEGKAQLTLQPLASADSDQAAWILFMRDVTLEERLQKKYRAELEQKEDVIKDLETAKAELENYSKNLEKMVADRTRELSRLNQTMSALLDSLGQGFFIFDKEGTCFDVSSKACLDTIEGVPNGKKIWDALQLPQSQHEGIKKWMMTLFMEMLPFEDLAPLGPTTYQHTQGKHISLEYFPLTMQGGGLEGVVVVASDITSLVEAQRQAEQEKENAKLIIHLVKSKKEIARFIRDSEDMFANLKQQLQSPQPDFDAVFRYLHTLKGGAASYSIQKMTELCHQAEGAVNQHTKTPDANSFPLIKDLSQQVESSFRTFLAEAKEILGAQALAADRSIEVTSSQLQNVIQKLESAKMNSAMAADFLREKFMMESVGSFFESYQELSLRVAEKEGKKLKPVSLEGADIPVVPEIYSPLFATFVHAFRNAVDHGIEFPEIRQEQNKDSEGKISVSFSLLENSKLQIIVKDDGAGINPEKIRTKLESRGIDTKKENDSQVIQHIFDSQFSTREVVTETSGRGVGMDAIRSAALNLGGECYVKSQPGHGTELFVIVPYYKSAEAVREVRKAA